MKDLFTLNDNGESGSTETSDMFRQLSEDVNIVGAEKDRQHKQKHSKAAVPHGDHPPSGKGNCSKAGFSKRKGKGKETDDHSDGEVDEEKNILRSLFDAQGIHSAVNHDAILNAHDEEKTRLEEQASQVAQRAAEALRQS